MHTKRDASAWIVLATLATGFGRADCNLSDGQKWLFYPALNALTSDEVYELNRLVTSNFRNAQSGPDNTQVDTRKLYPISAAAYEYLTKIDTKSIQTGLRVRITVDCFKVGDIWTRARLFVQNRSQ